VARLWEQPMMDRLIALYRALGSRYDSSPYVEGFATPESTLSLGATACLPKGFSAGALVTQYERFANMARGTMPNTSVFFYANYIGSDSLMSTLIQSMVEPDTAVSGVNVMPDNITQAQKVWTGRMGADYRGLLALGNSVEALELVGTHGTYTPQQLYTFAHNTLGVNYMFWIRNTWSGGAAQRWSTGILPFLRTNPPLSTKCPVSYGICNTR
jgi:hypothetical protein